MQKTLSRKVEIEGVGLHSGLPSKLVINPAPENSGIVFVRSDLEEKNIFPALYSQVVDTRNCTCLGNENKQIVSTIEHIMATLYALGVIMRALRLIRLKCRLWTAVPKFFMKHWKMFRWLNKAQKDAI